VERLMEHLPFELDFMHKYNLHKWLGLLIEDDDIRFISSMYGVKKKHLQEVDDSLKASVARLAEELRKRAKIKSAGKPYEIAAIGDSLSSDRQSWVNILNHMWRDEGKRHIIDCSISGDTTSHLLDRFYSSILNEEFAWAVVFIGTNDCRELDDDAHISNISFDEYERNMTYIMESLLNRGKKVINVTLPPADNERMQHYFPDSNQCYDQARIEKTNDYIRQLSKKYKTNLADLAGVLANYNGDFLEQDGIHISGDAQVMLCELIVDILP
jgi:lysophospholipase L1-like esterase